MVVIAAKIGNKDNNAPIEPNKADLSEKKMLAWVSSMITLVIAIATVEAIKSDTLFLLNRLYVEIEWIKYNEEESKIPADTRRIRPENSVSILDPSYPSH